MFNIYYNSDYMDEKENVPKWFQYKVRDKDLIEKRKELIEAIDELDSEKKICRLYKEYLDMVKKWAGI